MQAKTGDLITWDFKDDRFKDYPKYYRNNTFSSEIAMIDLEDRCYGVNAEYGQDMIPFDECVINHRTTQG